MDLSKNNLEKIHAAYMWLILDFSPSQWATTLLCNDVSQT